MERVVSCQRPVWRSLAPSDPVCCCCARLSLPDAVRSAWSPLDYVIVVRAWGAKECGQQGQGTIGHSRWVCRGARCRHSFGLIEPPRFDIHCPRQLSPRSPTTVDACTAHRCIASPWLPPSFTLSRSCVLSLRASLAACSSAGHASIPPPVPPLVCHPPLANLRSYAPSDGTRLNRFRQTQLLSRAQSMARLQRVLARRVAGPRPATRALPTGCSAVPQVSLELSSLED